MIEGKTINLGGEDYVIAPLTLGQIRSMQKEIESIGRFDAKTLNDGALDIMIKVIHAGMSRNYPEITTEKIEGLIDLKNIRDVVEAVLGVSGLKKE